MKKITSVITAVVAAAAVTASASAYTIDKDLGFGWSANTTVSGDVFADVTPSTTVTITYEANKALADMPGQEYWCLKLMVNDEGWPFIDNLTGLELSEGKDSYPVDPEADSISFTIPADSLELVQNAGMAFMGHGIKLLEMNFSDEPAGPVDTDPTDTTPSGTSSKNPDTGVEGLSAVIGAGVLALGAVLVSRRRK